ncbi:MAG: carboxypeptidase-like regulatory domain-containing protein [Bacteroidetes bacterium]|nr:carboxypeptidase-like regulatory domain-containing protein [Bacteroidota bacterium]
MRAPSLILWLLFLLPSLAYPQNATVKGILQDNDTRAPLIDASVSLVGTSTLSTQSSTKGIFEFKNVPFGKYTLEIVVEGYDKTSQEVEVNSTLLDLGPVSAIHSENLQLNLQDNLPTMSLSESDVRENSSQAVAGVLTAGRDPFANAAAFNFSAGRFRNRGYDNENLTLMNGIPA